MHRQSIFGHRRAGVLLHPTSLSGPGHHGTLGERARQFLDFLSSAGMTVWQTLPLLPVNSSLSPYQAFSLFAGDTRLIDARAVIDTFELTCRDEDGPASAALIRAALDSLKKEETGSLCRDYQFFCWRHRYWLHPWCQFHAIHQHFGGVEWTTWPISFRNFEPDPVLPLDLELITAMNEEAFRQFLFHQQWLQLKTEANKRGIAMFGDLPFYPSADSADTWQHPELFDLESHGQPRHIAGVEPYAFSDSGQSWGAPVYRWDRHQFDGFNWWLRRLMRQLELFDILRVDHFIGLSAYWPHPPYSSPTKGEWIPAPGNELLTTVFNRLGPVPLVAEDLSQFTPDVTALRKAYALPGMRVIQFGFDDLPDNPHHPARHQTDCVAYTGTHDNNTIIGWWNELSQKQKARVQEALPANCDVPNEAMHWRMNHLCLGSPARLAILPMQDILGLGSEARMNRPGTQTGNWCWRLQGDENLTRLAHQLRQLVEVCDRTPTEWA